MGDRIRGMSDLLHIKHLKIYPFLVIMIPSLLIISSLASADPLPFPPAGSRYLTIGFQESVWTLNPFLSFLEPDYFAISCIYDCLTAVDEDGLQSPNLAESWRYMNGLTAASTGSDFSKLLHNKSAADWPTGSIWEYNLTDNIYWNDGEPFTADDVVWTVNTMCDLTKVFSDSENPLEYTRMIDHIEKVNESIVRIFFADFDTNKPTPIAWGDSLFFPILPNHVFVGKPLTYFWTWNGWPAIGTGPYYLKSNPFESEVSIFAESITLNKNEFYNFSENGTGKGLGYHFNRAIDIDKVIMKFFSDESTLVLNVKTGGVDIARILPATYNSLWNSTSRPVDLKLKATYGCDAESKISHFNAYNSSSMNPTRLDPAVQRAAALAVNKSEIASTIYKDMARVGVGLISPASKRWFWEPSETEQSYFNVTDSSGNVIFTYHKDMKHVMDYDPALANNILDAAGYVWDNTTYPSLDVDIHVREAGPLAAARMASLNITSNASAVIGKELWFENVVADDNFEEREIGDYIGEHWKDIGIILTPNLVVSKATWEAKIYGYSFNFTTTGLTGDPDPNSLLFAPTSDSIYGSNEFGTENATYDYYYDMQSKSLNYIERKHWVDECQKWQYLSGTIITTSYPMKCFAINYKIWNTWGDWTTHPGLAIDNYWGGATFFFNIRLPTTPTNPEIPYVPIIAIFAITVAATAVIVFLALNQEKKRRGPPSAK